MAVRKPAAAQGVDVATAEHELGRTIVTLLLKEPFYGHLLGGINRRVTTLIPTAAVALTPTGAELIVNPDFFMTALNPQERVAVLKHEILHLVFRHLYRPLLRESCLELFNLAADLVVNQFVAPWPLPAGAITLATFPDLKLAANQTLEAYYQRLLTLQQHMSGAATDAPLSAAALAELTGTRHSDHRFWAAAGGFGFQGGVGDAFFAGKSAAPLWSEALCRALEMDGERQILRAQERTATAAWGKVSADVRIAVESLQARYQSTVDWRRVLRLFAASGYRTRLVPTKKRMSKRFQHFPGLRIKRQQRLAVVLDTSGSIDAQSMAQFFAEVHRLWRTGAEVQIIEADAAVLRTYPYQGNAPETVSGGGGTDFEPALRWVRDPKQGGFDACIYLTDGYADTPRVHPLCPLLWVLVSEPEEMHTLPGRVIYLRNT